MSDPLLKGAGVAFFFYQDAFLGLLTSRKGRLFLFYQDAFLGQQTSQEFRDLPLEESKRRLGEIFDKIDAQIVEDGFVTDEELSVWIKTTKRRSNEIDSNQRVKKNDQNGIMWNNYFPLTCLFVRSSVSLVYYEYP